jgi:hypothetical protein
MEDQELLMFGTIFLEHILCKVSRFAYLLRKTRRKHKKGPPRGDEDEVLSLKRIGRQAAQGATWVSGANVNDPTGKVLPIPVGCDKARLQASVELWA